jgi:hypothetical protein
MWHQNEMLLYFGLQRKPSKHETCRASKNNWIELPVSVVINIINMWSVSRRLLNDNNPITIKTFALYIESIQHSSYEINCTYVNLQIYVM